MGLGDFIFFVAYALVGLVPPLSSFFLTLLEYDGLQLQHLDSLRAHLREPGGKDSVVGSNTNAG
jgi:hypothetical protein